MNISSKQIASALMRSLEDGADIKTLASSFEEFVKENHLEALIPNIVKNIDAELKSSQKKRTIDITTSHDVKDATIQSILKFVGGGGEDPIETSIDETLIGGFRAEYKGKVFDGSVKNYLKELKEALLK